MKSIFTIRASIKNLLIINDHHVSLLPWEKNQFGEAVWFPNSPEGVRECGSHLALHPLRGPVYLQADILEEELHRETLPRLSGRDRRDMIQRRLERWFRTTPYRQAESQGQSQPGFERVLFCGLTEAGRIQPWVQVLRQHNQVIAGLWSVPLLSRALLQRITPIRANHALLISFNREGQRQTSFYEGRTILSRMIPAPPLGPHAAALAVIEEVEKTRLYLASLRLVPKEAVLHAFILAPNAMSAAIAQQIQHHSDPRLTLHLLETTHAAEHLGLVTKSGEQEADLLFGHWLLTTRQKSNPYPLPAAVTPVTHGTHVPDSPSPPVHRLGDLLVDKGVITPDQLAIALTEQNRTQQPLGKALVMLGFLTEKRLRDLLGGMLQRESFDLSQDAIDPEAAKIVPKEFAKRHGVVPVSWQAEPQHLVVAMANTQDVATLDRLMAHLPAGTTIDAKLATESQVSEALDSIYGFELSVDGILHEIENGTVDLESLFEQAGRFSHPMVRLVNALLVDAVKRNASDIHFGPMAGFIQIRYRIDGVLRQIRSLHQKFQGGLTVRLKIMSGMDIAETRQSQDGHFSLNMGASAVDFRVSTQLTQHGENIVLRILDRAKGIISLDALGLTPRNRACLNVMMERPEGIILVTGPSGSGKTTTLYSMISSLNAMERNIMTLEDPVEYSMQSILQSSVKEDIKLSFASGIRSILRQDPDIIMVGEIRDTETAQMALRAAMTGHQVYSTLHTNSALAAIPRLLDMGLEPFTLIDNIIGVLAQRLVRRLCPHCKSPHPLDPGMRQTLGLPEDLAVTTLYKAVGCAACGGIGFKGRLCVMEALIADNNFHDLISRSAHPAEFRQAAINQGFQTMWEDGVRHLLDGQTSLDEITRVLGRTSKF